MWRNFIAGLDLLQMFWATVLIVPDHWPCCQFLLPLEGFKGIRTSNHSNSNLLFLPNSKSWQQVETGKLRQYGQLAMPISTNAQILEWDLWIRSQLSGFLSLMMKCSSFITLGIFHTVCMLCEGSVACNFYFTFYKSCGYLVGAGRLVCAKPWHSQRLLIITLMFYIYGRQEGQRSWDPR